MRAPTDAEKQLEPTLSIAVEKNEIYLGELLPIQVIISTSPRTKEIASNVFPDVESDGFIMQPLNRHFQARQDAAGRRLSFFEGHCEALKAGDPFMCNLDIKEASMHGCRARWGCTRRVYGNAIKQFPW